MPVLTADQDKCMQTGLTHNGVSWAAGTVSPNAHLAPLATQPISEDYCYDCRGLCHQVTGTIDRNCPQAGEQHWHDNNLVLT